MQSYKLLPGNDADEMCLAYLAGRNAGLTPEDAWSKIGTEKYQKLMEPIKDAIVAYYEGTIIESAKESQND